MQGKIKWFSNEKGFGFIVSQSGIDHFFRVQDILGADLPRNGDKVTFISTEGPKGFKADSISIEHENRPYSSDTRIACPSCNKKIVPRIVVRRGVAEKSLCQFCGCIVKEFTIPTPMPVYEPSSGPGVSILIGLVCLIFFIIFFMAVSSISGVGWALFWTPFIAFGAWSRWKGW